MIPNGTNQTHSGTQQISLRREKIFRNWPSPKFKLCAGHNYIGTEHILLGLLREGEGVAARVLETLGADPQKIRTAVYHLNSLLTSDESEL
jgi:ATP-dependent Clp protease ATP-binding subunit ClpA